LRERRFILLYSALLRLAFEPLVKEARDVGWGQRDFREVVISGVEGLAHRWLAAWLYEERADSGDSAVFVIHHSRPGVRRRIRTVHGHTRQESSRIRGRFVLNLERFGPRVVEQWAALLLEKAGRPLPAFLWNDNEHQEQILFKLAEWLGLDAESL